MTDGSRRVIAGVDAHTDEHHAAVLDESGRLLGTAAFPTTREGYEQLIAWVAEHGVIDRIGSSRPAPSRPGSCARLNSGRS
jgi:transposase